MDWKIRKCDMRDEIRKLWEANRGCLAVEMRERLLRGDIYILYDIQIYTNNLLRYACAAGDDELLDGLCELYLIACETLTRDGAGARWVFTCAGNAELNFLLNQEIPLISSQFLCAAAECIRGVAGLPPVRRTPDMLRHVQEFTGVITGFLSRHYDGFKDKLQRAFDKPYPPVSDEFDWGLPVFDDQLFILAVMAHLLLAQTAAPELAILIDAQPAQYRVFIGLGSALLEKRLTLGVVRDFDGNEVQCCNFDLGVWDGYEDYAYTGYTDQAYPAEPDKRAARNVGWDISHARRFVNVFDALHDARPVTGLRFPDETVMRFVANQLVYGAFNGDFTRPLFTNFMDGTNGWYRVGYAGRMGFGYAPYGLSDAVPTGGYGFWSRFNCDVTRVMGSILSLLRHAGAQCDDEAAAAFACRHYACLLGPDSRGMLMFLPACVCQCHDTGDQTT